MEDAILTILRSLVELVIVGNVADLHSLERMLYSYYFGLSHMLSESACNRDASIRLVVSKETTARIKN